MPTTHKLDAQQVHHEWNNALAPRLTIDPGDTVVFDTRDASDHYYSRKSTHPDVMARGPFRGHPLTGPVSVRGAEPGDTLVIEVELTKARGKIGQAKGICLVDGQIVSEAQIAFILMDK